jgi:hypothetical protein
MDERQWEIAARMYCRTIGLDPEAMVEDVTYRGGAWCTRRQWKQVVDDLKRHEAMREAIEFGKSA